jgi:hypothetical protein
MLGNSIISPVVISITFNPILFVGFGGGVADFFAGGGVGTVPTMLGIYHAKTLSTPSI